MAAARVGRVRARSTDGADQRLPARKRARDPLDVRLPRPGYGRCAAAVVRGARRARRRLRSCAPDRVRPAGRSLRRASLRHADARRARVGDDPERPPLGLVRRRGGGARPRPQPRRGRPRRRRTRACTRHEADSRLRHPCPDRARRRDPPAPAAGRVHRSRGRRLRPPRGVRLRPQPRRDGQSARRRLRDGAVPTRRDHLGRHHLNRRPHRLPLRRPVRAAPEDGDCGRDRGRWPIHIRGARYPCESPRDERGASVRLRRRPVGPRGHLLLRSARRAARAPALVRLHGRDAGPPEALGAAGARRGAAAGRARDRADLPLQHLGRTLPDHARPADDAARRCDLSPTAAGRHGGSHRRRDALRCERVQRRQADGTRRHEARLVALPRGGAGADASTRSRRQSWPSPVRSPTMREWVCSA